MISYIVPTYNVEKYISSTLNSLLNQTSKDFEVIVVDDGSTDCTIDLIEEIINENRDFNIRLIEKQNGGVSSARNQGLLLAKGDYILFLDGDDLIDKELTQQLLLEVGKTPDIICFGYNRVTENGELLSNFFSGYHFPEKISSGTETLIKIIREKKFKIWTGSAAYNKMFLQRNCLQYTEGCHSGEDTEFTYKALLLASKVLFINKVLSYYVMRDGSITNSYSIKKFQSIYAIWRIVENVENNSDKNIKKLFNKNKEDMVISRYISNYNSCLDYGLINKLNKKQVLNNINYDIDQTYPNLRNELMNLMKNYRGPNFGLFIKIRLFLISPLLYNKLFNLKNVR